MLHLYIFKNTKYSALNATIFTFISPPYGMFRHQMAIIKCFVNAQTVALYKVYKMFTYLYTCKCDVSCLIYLKCTRYLFALINVTQTQRKGL
jgi:hypothetical protein